MNPFGKDDWMEKFWKVGRIGLVLLRERMEKERQGSESHTGTIFRPVPVFPGGELQGLDSGMSATLRHAQINADYLSLTENTEAQRERTRGLGNISVRKTWAIIFQEKLASLISKTLANFCLVALR